MFSFALQKSALCSLYNDFMKLKGYMTYMSLQGTHVLQQCWKLVLKFSCERQNCALLTVWNLGQVSTTWEVTSPLDLWLVLLVAAAPWLLLAARVPQQTTALHPMATLLCHLAFPSLVYFPPKEPEKECEFCCSLLSIVCSLGRTKQRREAAHWPMMQCIHHRAKLHGFLAPLGTSKSQGHGTKSTLPVCDKTEFPWRHIWKWKNPIPPPS